MSTTHEDQKSQQQEGDIRKIKYDVLIEEAENGYRPPQYIMGVLYHYADEPNYEKDFTWYEKAARNGLNAVQTNLASFYARGTGVEANAESSRRWAKLGYYSEV